MSIVEPPNSMMMFTQQFTVVWLHGKSVIQETPHAYCVYSQLPLAIAQAIGRKIASYNVRIPRRLFP